MSEGVPTPTPPLEYQQPISLFRTRRFQRKLIWCVIIIVGAIVAHAWLPELIWQVKVRYWEHQCAANPIAPGKMILIANPAITATASQAAVELFNVVGLNYAGTPATVYSGYRQSSGGLPRLIVIQAEATVTAAPSPEVAVNFFVAVPPTGIDHRRYEQNRWVAGDHMGNNARVPSPSYLQVWAATEDPANSSHFSFAYWVFFERYTVDCWLMPDGSIYWDQIDQHGEMFWGHDSKILHFFQPR